MLAAHAMLSDNCCSIWIHGWFETRQQAQARLLTLAAHVVCQCFATWAAGRTCTRMVRDSADVTARCRRRMPSAHLLVLPSLCSMAAGQPTQADSKSC